MVVWNTANWKPHLVRIEDQGISHIVFSRDSKQLAYTTGKLAVLLNVAGWEEVNRWKAHDNRAHSIDFSPDGTRLVTSGATGTVKLWNLNTAEEVKSFQAGQEIVFQAAFSPDGSRLLTAGSDHAAKLWDLKTFNTTQTFQPDSSLVRRIRWSRDGRYILTSRWDGYVRIRDAATGALLGFTEGGMQAADFSADNRLLVTTGSQSEAHVFRLSLDSPSLEQDQQIRKLIARFEEEDFHARESAQMEVAKFGMVAVPILREFADSSDAEVRIRTRILRRQLMSPQPMAKLGEHQGEVEVVCFSPNASQIATGSRGGDVMVWDASTFQQQTTLQLPTGKPGDQVAIP
jgi:WD40 repeat protein